MNILISKNGDVFSMEAEKGRLNQGADYVVPYTQEIASVNAAAAILGRYNELSKLSIPVGFFRRVRDDDEEAYGIKYTQSIHGADKNQVILKGQLTAAERFFSERGGFGLLADVVGSGKTYEAGVVLSELAAKGRISNFLLIVPENLKLTWLTVLERQFGVGVGQIVCLGQEFVLQEGQFTRREGGNECVPIGAFLVSEEDFRCWSTDSVRDVLFDVVVVDEAHHLCERKCAKSMALLSLLMQLKKRVGKSYCVLLSATPHEGNLEDMFPLWYFILKEGGEPGDFQENRANSGPVYKNELERYKEKFCFGATTVSEFIRNVKMQLVNNNEDFGCKFRKEFEAFYQTYSGNHQDKLLNLTWSAFSEMPEFDQELALDTFLRQNPKTESVLQRRIAHAYHNGLMRQIMVRQPTSHNKKRKIVRNFFFFHTKNGSDLQRTPVFKGRETMWHELRKITYNFYENEVTYEQFDSDRGGWIGPYTENLQDFLTSRWEGNALIGNLADFFFLQDGAVATVMPDDRERDEMVDFFKEEMRGMEMGEHVPTSAQIAQDGGIGARWNFCPIIGEAEQLFEAKLQKLIEILVQHANERAVIFFDYETPGKRLQIPEVIKRVREDSRFTDRVLSVPKGSSIEEEFNKKENANAILFADTERFREGLNLQKSRVIIHFHVTPDPLAMEQACGRVFRLGQEHDVFVYSLASMFELEGYVLFHYNRIGLMESSSGDAAIISGRNEAPMQTLRCPACGRIRRVTQRAYSKNQKFECCGRPMQPMSICTLRCDQTPAHVLSRRADRYTCLCGNGELGSQPSGRTFYCSHLCLFDKCRHHTVRECEVKRAISKGVQALSELQEACLSCRNRSSCDCHYFGDGSQTTEEYYLQLLERCKGCDGISCRPSPHILTFDDQWCAPCPECGGTLRPEIANDFDKYIREAFDGCRREGTMVQFIDMLLDESRRISQIQKILSLDNEKD